MERLWIAAGLGLLVLVGCEEGPTGVAPIPVARVEVSPSQAWVLVGDTLWLEATPFDAGNVALTTPVGWTVEDETLITLSQQGYRAGLVARAPGTVKVTATSGGRSAVGTVVVQPRAPTVHSVTHAGRGVLKRLLAGGNIRFDWGGRYRFHLRSSLDGQRFTAEFLDTGTGVVEQGAGGMDPLDHADAVR